MSHRHMSPEAYSHPEYVALMETVRKYPEDDAPRWAVSDWIEEHDGDDRAAFIRGQLADPASVSFCYACGPKITSEYDVDPEPSIKCGCQMRNAMRGAAFEALLDKPDSCPVCRMMFADPFFPAGLAGYKQATGANYYRTFKPAFVLRRGFVERINVTRRELHENGGLAFRSQPVTSVWLTDLSPSSLRWKSGGSRAFVWFNEARVSEDSRRGGYSHVAPWMMRDQRNRRENFRTKEEARASVSERCVGRYRVLVGLDEPNGPVLPEEGTA